MAKLNYQANKVKYELSQEEKKMRITFSDGSVKEYANLKAVEPLSETAEVTEIKQ